MHALGRHLLLDLRDCNKEVLNDLAFLRDALVSAAEKAGAEVLEKTFRQFEPQGVSGVVVIAESHLSIHTWPEHGYVAIDIFTCGDSVMPEVAAEALVAALGSRNPDIIELPRGLGVMAERSSSELRGRPVRTMVS